MPPELKTKLGWHLAENPPESYLQHCGGTRGIKIVGSVEDLKKLRNWSVPVRQARLITAEAKIEEAKGRNDLSEIPSLIKSTVAIYKAAQTEVGLTDVWYEIPPIMVPVNPWVAAWEKGMVLAFAEAGIPSVAFGFYVGYPQVYPFASAQSPDQWPELYDVLRAMHQVGTGRTRLGVEEYIVGAEINPDKPNNGLYNPADRSTICRLDFVYENHIWPNGWNILSTVIESGYDVKPMWDIRGMGPDNALIGIKELDRAYSKRPFVDTVFLYTVVDPVRSTEGSYAYTPPYLEKVATWIAANPPGGPLTGSVPGQPPQPPTPPPTPPAPPVNLIQNSSFEGEHHFDLSDTPFGRDRFGDRKVPEGGWGVAWNTNQAAPHGELDEDPPHVQAGRKALRIWSHPRFNGWYYQTLDLEAGASYLAEVWAYGHRETGRVGAVTTVLGIDVNGGIDFTAVEFKDVQVPTDQWLKLTVSFVAKGKTTLFLEARTGNDGRGDAWFDGVSLTRIAASPPQTKRKAVVNADGTRVRNAPVYGTIIWQQMAEEVVWVESVSGGWAKLVPRVQFPNAYISADLLDFI